MSFVERVYKDKHAGSLVCSQEAKSSFPGMRLAALMLTVISTTDIRALRTVIRRTIASLSFSTTAMSRIIASYFSMLKSISTP